MKEKQMQIPEHCSSKGEIVEGFGKVELMRTLIFSLVGLLVGVIILIFSKSIVSVVLSVVGGFFCGYLFCKKDRYSRSSIIDSLIDMKNFNKSQKVYFYRRDK